MTMTRVLPVFSVVFAIVYVLAIENNIAVMTYHPQSGAWGWGVQPPTKAGPAMYWYGWLATATAAGLGATLIALGVPRAFASRVPGWLSWGVPLAMMLTVFVLLRGFFLR